MPGGRACLTFAVYMWLTMGSLSFDVIFPGARAMRGFAAGNPQDERPARLIMWGPHPPRRSFRQGGSLATRPLRRALTPTAR